MDEFIRTSSIGLQPSDITSGNGISLRLRALLFLDPGMHEPR